MLPSTTTTSTPSTDSHESTLLTLPRELRNEIYTHLFLPSHTYSSIPPPNPYAIDRFNKAKPTPIDDKIFLPVRPPLNLLHTCAQTRYEVLEQCSAALNSSNQRAGLPKTDIKVPAKTEEGTSSSTPTPANDQTLSPTTTTTIAAADDSCVQLTLEVLTGIRASFGPYIPTRSTLSSRFLALLPVLYRAKRIHILVWAGWTWWQGPQPQRVELSAGRPQPARRPQCVSPDETDWSHELPVAARRVVRREMEERDALSAALDTVLRGLPRVEEVEVDVLMHVWDYWNWDLPQRRWEGVEGWLESRIGDGQGRRWRRVIRRLMVTGETTGVGQRLAFYRKDEAWRDKKGEGEEGVEVVVTEETAEVPDEFSDWSNVEYTSRTYTRREEVSTRN